MLCRGTVTRTRDPLVPNQMRYQLRYTPITASCDLLSEKTSCGMSPRPFSSRMPSKRTANLNKIPRSGKLDSGLLDPHRRSNHVNYEQDERNYGNLLRTAASIPVIEEPVDSRELQYCGDHSHKCATGDES